MKFKRDIGITYMGHLNNAWYADDVTDEYEIQPVMERFRHFTGPVSFLMPMFFVVDYTSRSYLIFTDNIKKLIGYDARELLENGLGFTLDITDKKYFKTVNEKIFPINFELLRSIPQHEHQNYIFSFNNRYKKKNGEWADVLQKSIFITSKHTGMPLLSLGMVIDNSIYKRDRIITRAVEKLDTVTGLTHLIATDEFYPIEEDRILTRTEHIIAQYMAEGLSSKVIADKLRLSENTIANHRKNMLRKTETNNVAHLVAYLIKNRVI